MAYYPDAGYPGAGTKRRFYPTEPDYGPFLKHRKGTTSDLPVPPPIPPPLPFSMPPQQSSQSHYGAVGYNYGSDSSYADPFDPHCEPSSDYNEPWHDHAVSKTPALGRGYSDTTDRSYCEQSQQQTFGRGGFGKQSSASASFSSASFSSAMSENEPMPWGQGTIQRGRGGSFTSATGRRQMMSDYMDDSQPYQPGYRKQQGNIDFNKIKEALEVLDQIAPSLVSYHRGRGMRGFGGQRGKPGLSSRGQHHSQDVPPRGRGRAQNRGMGRNEERGRGRGQGRGTGKDQATNNVPFRGTGRRLSQKNQVAPVHSLAKVQVDPDTLALPEKIRRFCLFVQNETPKVNDIQTIENALTGCRLNLKSEYVVEELMKQSNKSIFTGSLNISDIFLARCVGANKKEVKHLCYCQALQTLKSKTVYEILQLKDKGVEELRKEVQESLQTGATALPNEPVTVKDADFKCEDLSNRLVAEKLAKLIAYLHSSHNDPGNRISELEMAFSASHCQLQHVYDVQDTRLANGRIYFKGKLTVADIVIAQSSAPSKKQTKMNTYEKAVTSLKTKTLREIMKGVSPTDFDLPLLEEPSTKIKDKPPAPHDLLTVTDKLTILEQKVTESTCQNDLINMLDVTTHQLQIVPTCLYRKVTSPNDRHMLICELYLDGILISSGEGDKRREAQLDAYMKAMEVLTTTPVPTIVNDYKRLTDEDRMAPDVMEILVKGFSRCGDSNARRLRYMTNLEGEKRDMTDLVILEHEDWSADRRRHAFCILNQSATQSGLLLSWQLEPHFSILKCTMSVQNVLMGEAYARGKNEARTLAAADALFKLYEKQPVVKICSRDDSKNWISYDEVKKRAESLTSKDESERVDDNKDNPEKREKETGNEGEQVESSLVQAIESYFKEYLEKDTLDDLLFGPGFNYSERKQLMILSRKYQLRHIFRQHAEQSYTAISRKVTPKAIVEILRQHPDKGGRYMLASKEEIPKHSDIATYLKTSEQLLQSCHFSEQGKKAGSVGQSSGTKSFQTSTPKGKGENSRPSLWDQRQVKVEKGKDNTVDHIWDQPKPSPIPPQKGKSGSCQSQRSFESAKWGDSSYMSAISGSDTTYQSANSKNFKTAEESLYLSNMADSSRSGRNEHREQQNCKKEAAYADYDDQQDYDVDFYLKEYDDEGW